MGAIVKALLLVLGGGLFLFFKGLERHSGKRKRR
jgi:hypothetical protein